MPKSHKCRFWSWRWHGVAFQEVTHKTDAVCKCWQTHPLQTYNMRGSIFIVSYKSTTRRLIFILNSLTPLGRTISALYLFSQCSPHLKLNLANFLALPSRSSGGADRDREGAMPCSVCCEHRQNNSRLSEHLINPQLSNVPNHVNKKKNPLH